MELAPIGVSTYSRINHLKQTIEALQKNTLAKESELYIFSDAPQKGDEEIVQKVRDYIHTVDGFKKVHIVERETNGRVANNRGGFQWLLDKYGKAIFLEDDIVTAPGFLQFMNDALEFYKDNEKITFVSGYVIPGIILDNSYNEDVFLLNRFESWGIGLWSRSFKYFEYISKDKYEKVYNNQLEKRKLLLRVGEEAMDIISKDYLREMDGGDVKVWFWQFIYDTYTIYPKKSLVKSIGQDGSGVHMGMTNKWDIVELWDKENFNFVKDIKVEQFIQKMNFNFYRTTPKVKLILLLKKLGLFNTINKVFK